jgi:hypothetical protein
VSLKIKRMNTSCATLIERYMSTCGLRFFRGQHDGEYFFVVNADKRLHVHLEVSPSFSDVLTIRVTPASFYPVSNRPWLTQFADTWNEQNREVTAIVHGSSDPQRVGVVARRSQWIREGMSLEDFAAIVDHTLTAAIDLFAEVTPVVELPCRFQAEQPVLRNAS